MHTIVAHTAGVGKGALGAELPAVGNSPTDDGADTAPCLKHSVIKGASGDTNRVENATHKSLGASRQSVRDDQVHMHLLYLPLQLQ